MMLKYPQPDREQICYQLVCLSAVRIRSCTLTIRLLTKKLFIQIKTDLRLSFVKGSFICSIFIICGVVEPVKIKSVKASRS